MTLLRLTRATEFLGSFDVVINADCIECILPILTEAPEKARICIQGSDTYYDVMETITEIFAMIEG